MKRAVSPLVDVCNRLMRFDIRCISEETRPYFRDVYDHAVRINEMVDNTRELLNSAMEANFSLISISQSEVGKKFAGWRSRERLQAACNRFPRLSGFTRIAPSWPDHTFAEASRKSPGQEDSLRNLGVGC